MRHAVLCENTAVAVWALPDSGRLKATLRSFLSEWGRPAERLLASPLQLGGRTERPGLGRPTLADEVCFKRRSRLWPG